MALGTLKKYKSSHWAQTRYNNSMTLFRSLDIYELWDSKRTKFPTSIAHLATGLSNVNRQHLPHLEEALEFQ